MSFDQYKQAGVLDKAESARDLLHAIKTHNNATNRSHCPKKEVNLLLARFVRQAADIQGRRCAEGGRIDSDLVLQHGASGTGYNIKEKKGARTAASNCETRSK